MPHPPSPRLDLLHPSRQSAEHERTKEKLRESEERYRSLVAAMSDVVWSTNAAGEIVEDLEGWRNLTGQTAEEMHGFGWLDVIHPEDQERVARKWEQCTRARTPYEAQQRIRTADGTWRQYIVNGVPIIERETVREWVGTCVDITDRDAAENALRKSEDALRTVLSSLTSHIAVLDREGAIIAINAAWGRFAEENKADFRSAGVGANYLHACQAAADRKDPYARNALDGIRAVLEGTAKEFRLEYPCHSPTERRWFLMVVSPFDRESGGAVVSHLNITQIKRAEEFVNREKAVLEMVATGASMPAVLEAIARNVEAQSVGLFCSILLLDPDGRRLFNGASPSLPAEYVHAINGEEIGPRNGSCGTSAYRKERVIVSDIATDPLWADYKEVALKHGLRACWSTPIQSSEGDVLGTFAVYYGAPRSPTAEDLRTIDLATHLTQIAIVRQRTECALRKSNEHLSSLVRTAPLGIAVVDAQEIVQAWSPGAEAILGWSPTDMIGRNLPIVPETERQEFCELLSRGLAGQVTKGKEIRRVHKDGSIVNLSIWISPQMGENDQIVGVIGVFADIGERKRNEERLRQANDRFEFIGQATNDVVWDWDITRDTLWWNANFYALFGHKPVTASLNVSWLELLHPEDRGWVKEGIDRLIEGSGVFWREEYRFRRSDGSFAEVLDRGYVIRDQAGKAVRMIGGMMDITERKETEQKLDRSRQELRLLGAHLRSAREDEATRIARELHDELGATLTGLKIDLASLERGFDQLAETEKADRFRARTTRALGMIDSMMKSVRKICLELRPGVLDQLGLATAIEWQATEFEGQSGIHCSIVRPEDVRVATDTATAVFRIFQEILTNVRRHAGATEVKVELREEKETIVLTVQDNGQGMPTDALLESNRLGIVGMRERAFAAGGRLRIESAPGAGTTIIFEGPAAGRETSNENATEATAT